MAFRSRWIRRPAVLLLSLLIGGALSEGILRLFDLPRSFRIPNVPEDRWTALIHRRSCVPGLSYELRPTNDFPGQTNSLGLRDTISCMTPSPSTRRIVCLGDSFTYGFGVKLLDTYPKRLESRLLERGPGWQVINMGVGGYSSRDEAIVLRFKAAQLRPDLVVVGYALNDPETEPLQALHNFYARHPWWHHVHAFRLLAAARRRAGQSRYDDYIAYLHGDARKWGSVVEAFASIRGTASEMHVPVLVAVFPVPPHDGKGAWARYRYGAIHDQVVREARASGFFTLDLLPLFRQHAGDSLCVSAADSHPSAFAHDLIGQALADYVRDSMDVPMKREVEGAPAPSTLR